MTFVPTAIDLSQIPPPAAIEPLDYETLRGVGVARFKSQWETARALDPTLPSYDVDMLETDPAMIAIEAWSYIRLLDRARVNDAIKAVLAPLAKGSDLDNIVARVNVSRLTIVPANGPTPAVMETDAQLLRRYLLAFDRPSAGSPDRYIYEALTAVPTLQDVAVIGRAIHGRLGDVDLVISGPAGAAPTSDQIAAVSAAVTATNVKPEATSVSVVPAVRNLYTLSAVVEIPRGPDPNVVIASARAAMTLATASRLLIGAEVPIWSVAGSAYGPNVIRVTAVSPPSDIPADPYTIPVCTGINITAQVQA